ncbi:histidine--tRNA ligase [Gorillibacterium timonense]|uniref:histidine--tRNA ligase n=1 Tax=Gorillibacterium timonense TaxID=1689269 RepID=UPI00071D4225|nr:histidine--tRNA ligase [Gorillibacterium timonense]
MNFQKPKGTPDFLPGTVEKWQYLENTARELTALYRYREVRTPIFEHTELFKRGVGETTDVVEKEMYTFADKADRSITLRPEGTAGTVRAYAENKLYADPDVTKLYYVGPMFRYEQPQAGRMRQFHQFGIEALGSSSPALDAEVIAFGYDYCRKLGLKDVRVEVNSVGTAEIRANFRAKLLAFLEPMKEELCRDCRSRMERNPLRVLDCKIDQHRFDGAPSILDELDEECRTHFEQVRGYLDAMGVPYEINPRLVRGLDYYTHTAFEYKAAGIGAIDTIGGGGRYNGLVGQIGGEEHDQPGVGMALGLERVLIILEAQGVSIPEYAPLDLYLIGLGDRAEAETVRLVHAARAAGLTAEKDYQGRKMKSAMKSADRSAAREVAILGDDELDAGVISIKTMATGEQRKLPLGDFIRMLAEEKAGRQA